MSERERLAVTRGGATGSRRLVASWRRSEDFRVSLDAVTPAFVGAVDDGSLFYESGHHVLTGLQRTLADEPVSLMLTDADGLVLSRLCGERALLTALDDVFLAPGFDYSEREAGTTGLGLALADRTASLVRGEEHYCTGLWGYTCAAAPVEDPDTGELIGSVNLTTWSQQSYGLLLALAETAARHTESLMLARTQGRAPRPSRRGHVTRFRVPETGDAVAQELSAGWRSAFDAAVAASADGRGLAVVGEPGTGRATLLGAALAESRPGWRVLVTRPPEPVDVDAWLSSWSPELTKPRTAIVLGDVDRLPVWAAAELAGRLEAAGDAPPPLALTAADAAGIPEVLADRVDTVVEVPALRYRLADVVPLARHLARRLRGREIRFHPAAEHALQTYHWPGNVDQLREVVRAAVTRSTFVTVRDLSPEIFTGAGHKLTRIETLERDAIVRCLSDPGATPAQAAEELGMSRATIYRRIAHYGIRLPSDVID
jgi:transcriptional regulator of acetoin/glycerol metabolism